jgi:hypothetical protein
MHAQKAIILPFPTATSAANSTAIVPPAPRPIEPPARPSVFDLYPEIAAELAELQRCGVRRIFGVFDWGAWSAATAAAKLYLLPMSGPAGVDFGPLITEAAHTAGFWNSRPLAGIIRRRARDGSLLPVLFPHFREHPSRYYTTPVSIPQPPREDLPALHGARLAGYTLYAAVPGEAVSVDLSALIAEANRRPRVSLMQTLAFAGRDPIIFGWRQPKDAGRRVVVFGFYGQSTDDSPELQTLVATLQGFESEL